jgi:ATP-dependent helicase/DNAse subunit B
VTREIWLSPVLGNNRERLLARCAEYLTGGKTDRLLYLAASHPLLDLATEKLLDGNSVCGVWGEFPVYLFRGFVRRILAEASVSVPGAVATGSTEVTRSSAKPPDPVATAPGTDTTLLTRVPIDREELPLRKSLISQIIKQLSASGRLKAIKPLANRDGCVNTIASLIGELQRAGKTAEEFAKAIEERRLDAHEISPPAIQNSQFTIHNSNNDRPGSQIDFDVEVALIYQKYTEALDAHGLTDEDADQLRALQIVRGDVAQVVNSRLRHPEPEHSQINNLRYSLPWLEQIELLVLDGFFDFTPVQGEILRYLIPRIPDVIVNVNHDAQNPDIFTPFASTIEHLQSIAPFEVAQVVNSSSSEPLGEPPQINNLRRTLFNAAAANLRIEEPVVNEPQINNLRCTLLECSDRELEVRSIAKEIKRLILTERYSLAEIALVVRERAAYADTIVRVFAEESIPCNLERRVEANHVTAIRACAKIFQVFRKSDESVVNITASELAHLIKTDYFRVADRDLEDLTRQFDQKYSLLLDDDGTKAESNEKLRAALGIGRWNPDNLENVIAYVGSDLPVDAWINRAGKLIRIFPSAEDAQTLIGGAEAEDPAATAEDEVGTPQEDEIVMDRRKRPAPVHPAAIGWTILVMRHLQRLFAGVPLEGTLDELQRALMMLLDRLQFSNQVNVPFAQKGGAHDIPQATLDVRGRESLRRAIAAAVRSFNYANSVVSVPGAVATGSTEHPRKPTKPSDPVATAPGTDTIALSSFIDEIERCLKSQTLSVGTANRDGLRVLEATDVRGLRFKIIFIAGMIEGGFPLRTSRDWLYPHEERLRLQKQGIFLEDISTDTLLKEEHYFYQAACRATERLYLTRPLALNDGSETVASYYIEELRRAIAPAVIEVKQIRGDVEGRDPLAVSSKGELGPVLIRRAEARNSNHANAGKLLSLATDAGHISLSALSRVNIEHARHGEWFGPHDGEITHPDLQRMLARHFGPEHVYSASRLSTYGSCAFRFFGNRVLRIEPRSEAALDLQAIDAGKLLHDILRRFFEKHRGDYLPARDRQALRDELGKTADTVFREHEDKVPPLNERIWRIDCEIRKLILDQVLQYEIKLQEKTNGRVQPRYFELAFGRKSVDSDPKSTRQFLKLERAGDAALLQGQIDRVDVNEEERLAIAYDYKLSKGATLDDIKTGRQVQIPIYLAALEQLFLRGFELGGGGYYTLRGKAPRLNQGLYRNAMADCTHVTSRFVKFDDLEWQQIRQDVATRVWEFIDGMRGGRFRVKPSLGKHTCKFCDYSAVCRYDAYRINRKK